MIGIFSKGEENNQFSIYNYRKTPLSTHVNSIDPFPDWKKGPLVGDVIQEHHAIGSAEVTPSDWPK